MTHDAVGSKGSDTRYPDGERYRTLRGWEVVLWDAGGFGGYPRLRELADHLSMQVHEQEFNDLIALRDYKGVLTLFVRHHPNDYVTPLGAAALAIWRVLDMGGEQVYFADEDDLNTEWAEQVSRSVHRVQSQKVVDFPGKDQ